MGSGQQQWQWEGEEEACRLESSTMCHTAAEGVAGTGGCQPASHAMADPGGALGHTALCTRPPGLCQTDRQWRGYDSYGVSLPSCQDLGPAKLVVTGRTSCSPLHVHTRLVCACDVTACVCAQPWRHA